MKETPLISNDLLKLLVCPISGSKLEPEFNDKDLKNSPSRLLCRGSSRSYQIKDGVPIMVPCLSEEL